MDKTYLAIDYGERRIGVAKSDPLGVIASALTTIETRSQREAVEQVAALLEAYHPRALVVGYPLLESGDRSDKCAEVDRFIEKLKEFYNGPIHKVDESHSTTEAADIVHAHGQKVGKDKKRLDRLAAVVILQRFLSESLPPKAED